MDQDAQLQAPADSAEQYTEQALHYAALIWEFILEATEWAWVFIKQAWGFIEQLIAKLATVSDGLLSHLKPTATEFYSTLSILEQWAINGVIASIVFICLILVVWKVSYPQRQQELLQERLDIERRMSLKVERRERY